MNNHPYDLEERLLEFSTQIIKMSDKLYNTRAGNHVGHQVLRSGTSALPNHGEAQAAESKRDFVHKMKIALKELRETSRWLKLIIRVPLVQDCSLVNSLLNECEELIKIFVVSIRTAQNGRN